MSSPARVTDLRGQFVIETPIERTTAHSWIVALKGYKADH